MYNSHSQLSIATPPTPTTAQLLDTKRRQTNTTIRYYKIYQAAHPASGVMLDLDLLT